MYFKKKTGRGAWLAQLAGLVTLDFTVVSLSPTMGAEITSDL